MVKWLGPHEFTTLLLLAVVVVGLWAFLAVAGEMVEGDTRAYDREIILSFGDPHDIANPRGPKWLRELGRDFTALGGVGILTFVTLSVLGFLAINHKYREALLILGYLSYPRVPSGESAAQEKNQGIPSYSGHRPHRPGGAQSRLSRGARANRRTVAGWTMGVTWAMLCWLVARWLQYRGSIGSGRLCRVFPHVPGQTLGL